MRPREYDISGVVMLRRRLGGGPTSPFDGQIGTSLDDGSSRTGFFGDTYGSLFAGLNSSIPIDLWARFPSVDIPNGVTIDAAKVTVKVGNSDNDGAGVKTNIYMNDIDSAIAPTSIAEHIALDRTTAFTAWDDVDFSLEVWVDSPDISPAIKEVIDRPGWSIGNALQVLIDDDGSANGANKYYRFYAWDDTPAKAIKLHVEWS